MCWTRLYIKQDLLIPPISDPVVSDCYIVVATDGLCTPTMLDIPLTVFTYVALILMYRTETVVSVMHDHSLNGSEPDHTRTRE